MSGQVDPDPASTALDQLVTPAPYRYCVLSVQEVFTYIVKKISTECPKIYLKSVLFLLNLSILQIYANCLSQK